jgi:predicted Zn-dependent protease with MMP-like domain
MHEITDQDFDNLITECLDELPKEFTSRLDNIAITYEDQPSADQRRELKLRCDQSLFGLYEGIPLTRRNAGYSGVTPDKITIFKKTLMSVSRDKADLKRHTKRTLWHEIAHFFGLDHDRIHKIEKKMPKLF